MRTRVRLVVYLPVRHKSEVWWEGHLRTTVVVAVGSSLVDYSWGSRG